jgi:hypothetical protein
MASISAQVERLRVKRLEKALDDLLLFVTSGRRYKTQNPYTIDEVKEAIRVLSPEDYRDIYGLSRKRPG